MFFLILRTFITTLGSHRALALENLALRHQLDVLQRNVKRPRLTNRDRTLWIILSRLWTGWRKVNKDNRDLIRTMSRANPLWSAPLSPYSTSPSEAWFSGRMTLMEGTTLIDF